MNNEFHQAIAQRFAVYKFLVRKGFFASANLLLLAMHKKNLKEIYNICKFWRFFV